MRQKQRTELENRVPRATRGGAAAAREDWMASNMQFEECLVEPDGGSRAPEQTMGFFTGCIGVVVEARKMSVLS